MKNMIIVEDKPWITKAAILDLQKKSVKVSCIVYYPNKIGDPKEKEKLLNDLKESTGVPVETVNGQEQFVKTMEKLYSQENTVFLMDYDLTSDSQYPFDSRINILYARHKEYEDKNVAPEDRKIWFYTVSGISNVELLRKNFPGHQLSVTSYQDGLLKWNEEELDKIVGVN